MIKLFLMIFVLAITASSCTKMELNEENITNNTNISNETSILNSSQTNIDAKTNPSTYEPNGSAITEETGKRKTNIAEEPNGYSISYSSSYSTEDSFSTETTTKNGETITKKEESSNQNSAKEFSIVAKKGEFVPNTMYANFGDEITIKITSIDEEHGFSLPAFGINTKVPAGKTVEVKFIADKKGMFDFNCGDFCSMKKEMSGQFFVI